MNASANGGMAEWLSHSATRQRMNARTPLRSRASAIHFSHSQSHARATSAGRHEGPPRAMTACVPSRPPAGLTRNLTLARGTALTRWDAGRAARRARHG